MKAGLPVFVSAMPMAGISAPYCYNGVLAMTHAEVLFGICAAQLINPGVTCVHAGFPTIADPRIEYNPNYGLISHNFLNILMTHLNLMLDLPTFQSAGTTHEEHPTDKAYADARMGQALCMKYGFHMMRHPFAFLRYLIDFSFEKLEKASQIAEEVTAEDAPDVETRVRRKGHGVDPEVRLGHVHGRSSDHGQPWEDFCELEACMLKMFGCKTNKITRRFNSCVVWRDVSGKG